MDKSNLDINIIDFIDLIDETLNATFIEKWRYKYSERFIKQFQFKILSSLTNSKPLKIDSLYLFFTPRLVFVATIRTITLSVVFLLRFLYRKVTTSPGWRYPDDWGIFPAFLRAPSKEKIFNIFLNTLITLLHSVLMRMNGQK